MEVLGKGIIHYVSPNWLIASRGRTLFISYDSGGSWIRWCRLPVSYFNLLCASNRWGARLTRREIHRIINVNEHYLACFGFGKIYLIKKETANVEVIGAIKGSRPLNVCSDGRHIYYGVYTGNEERKPIDLFVYSIDEEKGSIHHTFRDVRHIHGVFWDQYEFKLWATTGDLDHESTIWCFNNKERPEKVVSGSQQTRAVDLLFTEKAVFYATDAPHERNYIYRLDRESKDIESLQAVRGPVFFGRKITDWMFFSTIVEPSGVNRTDAVELWASGDQGSSWKKVNEFKKDIGHMKLFQYGQIKFPSGPGDGKNLWFSSYATEYDHHIMMLPLDSL